jgi:site-specific recombinase XerD
MTNLSSVRTLHRAPGRNLHFGHFAFMRAVVQGVDARDSWNRYLHLEGEFGDARVVRGTIQWIRDEFAAAARRFARHGTARLVLIDASRIVDRQATLPSLEEFAEANGLQDFSYAEQLEHYEVVHGKETQQQSRRRRLITKQLDALRWLESIAAVPPRADDPVFAWLNPELASRLGDVGILSLRQLLERINGIGRRWAAGIKSIGVTKGERVISWLRAHEETLGLSVGAHVSAKRSHLRMDQLQDVVPSATAIVPLEKLVIPPGLDGRDGRYRASHDVCTIDASNDLDAVRRWIDSKAPGSDAGRRSHTQRAYWKEAERFVLWAVVQQKKALSSMTSDDCAAYGRFLANPAPADLWCGPRGREKWSPLWRPFEGPLSLRAQRQAITILKNLYKFMALSGYLSGNPWEGIPLPEEVGPRMSADCRFDTEQWRIIENCADRLPNTSANLRLQFTLRLLHETGIGLAEAVAVKTDDLIADSNEWKLRIEGQGAKARTVVLPASVMQALLPYLTSRGLNADPAAFENRNIFLLGKSLDVAERAPWSRRAKQAIDAKEGIAAGTLYDQLKRFFAECAAVEGDEASARAIAAASARWLRHTHGAQRVAAGTPIDELQRDMGHASLRTTARYAGLANQ